MPRDAVAPTLAPALDRPIYHLAGTRLALYSRWDIVASEGDP